MSSLSGLRICLTRVLFLFCRMARQPQQQPMMGIPSTMEEVRAMFAQEISDVEFDYLTTEYHGVFCGSVQAPGCCDKQNPDRCQGKSCGNDNSCIVTTKVALAWISMLLHLIGIVLFGIWIGRKIDGSNFVPIITDGEADFGKGVTYFLLPMILAWAVTTAYYGVDLGSGMKAIVGIQIALAGLGFIASGALAMASLDTVTVATATAGVTVCLAGLLGTHIMKDNLSPPTKTQRTPAQMYALLQKRAAEKMGTGSVHKANYGRAVVFA